MSHNFYRQAGLSFAVRWRAREQRYVCNAKRRKHNDYVIWRTHKCVISIKPKKRKSFLLKNSHVALLYIGSRHWWVVGTTRRARSTGTSRCMCVNGISRTRLGISYITSLEMYSTLSNMLCRSLHALDDGIFCSAYLFLCFHRFCACVRVCGCAFSLRFVTFGISNNQRFGAYKTTSNGTVTRTVANIMATVSTQCQNETNTLWWTLGETLIQDPHTHAQANAHVFTACTQARKLSNARNLLPRFHFISKRWFDVERRTLDIEEECVVGISFRIKLRGIFLLPFLFLLFHHSP